MLLLGLRPHFTRQSLERPGGSWSPEARWNLSCNFPEHAHPICLNTSHDDKFPACQAALCFPDGRRDGTVAFTHCCLPPCYSHSLILVHYFGSSGCGDTAQVMQNPDEAFSLVLVFDGRSRWTGFHSGDEEAAIPGKCWILWAATFFWREFP